MTSKIFLMIHNIHKTAMEVKIHCMISTKLQWKSRQTWPKIPIHHKNENQDRFKVTIAIPDISKTAMEVEIEAQLRQI